MMRSGDDGPARGARAGAMLLAAGLAISSAPAIALAGETIATEVAVGQSVTVPLKGNPSTGYDWTFNDTASTGLDAVRRERLGWAKSETGIIGAPRVLNIRIHGRKPGEATLVYDYARSWENKPPARTTRLVVRVKPR